MATDLTISVEDQFGRPRQHRRGARQGRINIEGLLGIGFEGRGIIHVCVQDGAGRARRSRAPASRSRARPTRSSGPVQGPRRPARWARWRQ